MPSRILLFNAVQLLACLFALWRGGAPERWTAWMMAGAAALTALTALVPADPTVSFLTIDEPTLLVDGLLLVGLVALAVRADRFWPMWVAAAQLVAIAIHVVRGIDPTILPTVYNRSVGKVAYLMILFLVIGTVRHDRRARPGGERDWSQLRW